MAVIICDISAWEYWRTPPLLATVDIPTSVARDKQLLQSRRGSAPLSLRSDAREADSLIHGRLLTDLKGLSLPVHVFVDKGASMRESRIVKPHTRPACLRPDHLLNIGNGLQVLTPEATICFQPPHRGPRELETAVLLAKMIFEACGIFALEPQNERMTFTKDQLVTGGILAQEAYRHVGIYGYSDEHGRPLGDHDQYGNELPWIPVFNRRGIVTDMWKRPPIASIESIKATNDSLGREARRSVVHKALSMSSNGAASPAEVKANLLLCSGVWNGGESWGRPNLNQRINYTHEASALAHGSFCIADSLWEEKRSILEVQGESFHADEQGFRISSGRTAALDSMGYSVAELLPEQMANLELFDLILESLGKKLGFAPRKKTTAFLQRRNLLHRELFGRPYEP